MAGRRVLVFERNEEVLDIGDEDKDMLSVFGRFDCRVDLMTISYSQG